MVNQKAIITLVSIIVVLVFLSSMWDKITSSILGMSTFLGTIAILFGAGLAFGKLFRVY